MLVGERRLLAMASNVLPELPPEERVRAAALAGYQASGVWFEPETWNRATTRRVEAALNAGEMTRLVPLDIEVIRIRSGSVVPDAARRLIAVGGELGVLNVLVVSENSDSLETRRQFEGLCELSARAGMRTVLEFLMISSIRSLGAALEVVTSVGHPAGGVLIDPLHLQRCGGSPIDLEVVPIELLPYAQFCDAPASISGSEPEDYRVDAVDGRLLPGDGHLPLVAFLERFPTELPLSLEVRSRRLRHEFPDPVERAGHVLRRSEQFLTTRLNPT